MPAQDPELPAEVSRVDADLQATPSPVADVGQFVPSTELEEPPKSTSLAEPIPARMLNEFVYCPGLFYYEYVEGVFVENADTTRGAALHSRVDKGIGALPAAQSATTDEPAAESDDEKEESEATKSRTAMQSIHSRFVTLGSERLGVIAKLDLVEMREAEDIPELLSRLEVCPVDYKAGAPREGEEGNELWPTDKMQLGLQISILRDNGYHCDRGIIYYRATKQRVPLEWTPELEAWCWRRSKPRDERCRDQSRRLSLPRQSACDVL
jgi:CRISPR-associated protein Cas1